MRRSSRLASQHVAKKIAAATASALLVSGGVPIVAMPAVALAADEFSETIKIDYYSEALTGFDENCYYYAKVPSSTGAGDHYIGLTLNDAREGKIVYLEHMSVTRPADGAKPDDNPMSTITDEVFGQTVTLYKTTNPVQSKLDNLDGTELAGMPSKEIVIPARPEMTELSTEAASTSFSEDGKIKGTTQDMAYFLVPVTSSSVYGACSGSETSVKAGKYVVFRAATDSSFASVKNNEALWADDYTEGKHKGYTVVSVEATNTSVEPTKVEFTETLSVDIETEAIEGLQEGSAYIVALEHDGVTEYLDVTPHIAAVKTKLYITFIDSSAMLEIIGGKDLTIYKANKAEVPTQLSKDYVEKLNSKTLAIPRRRTLPQFTVKDASSESAADGAIGNTTSEMLYREMSVQNTGEWTACGEGTTAVPAGVYYVMLPHSETEFAAHSNPITIEVQRSPAPSSGGSSTPSTPATTTTTTPEQTTTDPATGSTTTSSTTTVTDNRTGETTTTTTATTAATDGSSTREVTEVKTSTDAATGKDRTETTETVTVTAADGTQTTETTKTTQLGDMTEVGDSTKVESADGSSVTTTVTSAAEEIPAKADDTAEATTKQVEVVTVDAEGNETVEAKTVVELTDAETGEAAEGVVTAGGKAYLAEDGVAATGFVEHGRDKYLARNDGTLAKGWAKVDGQWHYFGKKDYAQDVKWHKEPNGDWYYFSPKTGEMAKSQWHKDPSNGRWYYFAPNGKMVKNMGVQLGGAWYWFKPDGTAAQNETINGLYFAPSGKLRV